MRFVKFLACATLVAQADMIEDDDDMGFFRALSSNASNANNTDTGGNDNTNVNTDTGANNTSANNTSGGTDSGNAGGNNTNTGGTSSGTTGGNTTTGGGTGGSEDTGGSNEREGEAPIAQVPKAVNEAIAALNVTNGTDMNAVMEVSVPASFSAPDPMYCTFKSAQGETDASCETDAGASASNSTTNTTRRLQISTDTYKAHNLYCGAFSYAGSFAVCKGMGSEALVQMFIPNQAGNWAGDDSAADKAMVGEAVDGCVSGLTAAYIAGGAANAATATGACLQAADAAATATGVCYLNSYARANWAAIEDTSTPFQLNLPAVKACTKTTLPASKSAAADFTSTTMVKVPTWRTQVTGATALATIDAASLTAAAAAQTSGDLLTNVLSTAILIQAVQMSDIPIAGFNLTESMGIDASVLSDVKAALGTQGVGGLSLGSIAASQDDSMTAYQRPDSNLSGAAFTTLTEKLEAGKKAVQAAMPISSGGGGGGGASSSGATSLIMGASAVAGFVSLVF